MNDSSNITIELPQELKDRRISPTFYTNLVRPYIKNNDILFPKWKIKTYYNFGNNDEQEWFINEILAHKWANNDLELQVKWKLGDITWELISSCKDLAALKEDVAIFKQQFWHLFVVLGWFNTLTNAKYSKDSSVNGFMHLYAPKRCPPLKHGIKHSELA